jgi:hypothetical protein
MKGSIMSLKPARQKLTGFTLVFYTRDGGLHPAWQADQGTCYMSTENRLMNELRQYVANRDTMRGAYAIGIYAGYHPGYANAEELAANHRPLFYIYEGGRVERKTA